MTSRGRRSIFTDPIHVAATDETKTIIDIRRRSSLLMLLLYSGPEGPSMWKMFRLKIFWNVGFTVSETTKGKWFGYNTEIILHSKRMEQDGKERALCRWHCMQKCKWQTDITHYLTSSTTTGPNVLLSLHVTYLASGCQILIKQYWRSGCATAPRPAFIRDRRKKITFHNLVI